MEVGCPGNWGLELLTPTQVARAPQKPALPATSHEPRQPASPSPSPSTRHTEPEAPWKLACVAGGIFGVQEVKFFGGRAAKRKQRSREKYRLPENLVFLHAAHFYHLIDFN